MDLDEDMMGIEEALKVIEGNCRLLFERGGGIGEEAAWNQRQAFETVRREIERLKDLLQSRY